MTKFNKIILFLLLAALTSWLLPWGYYFITSRPASYPFTLYSPISHSFAFIEKKENQKVFLDSKGREYTEKQFDSILPTFYYRQLIADGRLPKNIEGIQVEAKDFYHENFMFRHSTSRINVNVPALYPLLEAMPARIDLEMPGDVFRINKRMEFIDIATNSVNETKSEQFTKMLLHKGFQFPARYIAGHPTTRKDYDEGYFITDEKAQLFHVKQLRGRPFVRNTGIPEEIKPKYIFPTEYPGRHTYCFLTDTANHLYALQTQTYQLKQIPVGKFDPGKENLTIFGNAFYWTLQIQDNKGSSRLYAFNPRDYSLADSLFPQPLASGQFYGRLNRFLFPFELSFTSYTDKWVYPRIDAFSAWAFLLNAVLAIGYIIIYRKNIPQSLPGTLILILLGIFGIIPLLIMKNME